ncbi:hypothetical protein [Streptomyces sp. NPDC007100]
MPPNWSPPSGPALGQGVSVRRGLGCTLRVSTVPDVHRQVLARCQSLDSA